MPKHEHHDCADCDKANLSKDEIGLNRKLLGDSVERFLCLDCLALYLDVTPDDLLAKVEEFKSAGCKLFS